MIKEIAGYDRKYFVSSEGIVYTKNMKEMHPSVNPNTGYCQINLTKNGKVKSYYVHRLVAEAFIQNPNLKKEVNHKDGNKQNNTMQNLEWCTGSENVLHSYMSGLKKTTCVSAFLKTGECVKTFQSVKDAMSFVGVEYNAGISRCLTGRSETAHGYVWKYSEAKC